MNAKMILGATALGALLLAGCQDNQALGTERAHDVVPNTPAPMDPAVPYEPVQAREGNPLPNQLDPMTQPRPGVDVSPHQNPVPPSANEPTAEGVKNDLEDRSADVPVDSSKQSLSVVEYVNGEDLSDVPEQVGSLWAKD